MNTSNETSHEDEFYIGYLPTAPAGLARLAKRVTLLLLLAGGVSVAWIASSQEVRTPGAFEFGTVRTFEGTLLERPLPMLRVAPPAETAGEASPLLLVGFGKTGLPEFAQGHHGKRVQFRGTLVLHGAHAMIELNDPDSFTVLPSDSASAPVEEVAAIGDVTLTGELVDTKCYFGVMRPATGKVHRACAIRCLSGGVPPGLLVRDDAGGAAVFLLAGAEGEPLEFDVEWAALTVTATGALELHGDLPVVRVRSLELTR